MAAITRTPRSRWIEEGLRALAAGGPDAVRVEALAQALGVTKGGFYGHFADRGALLEDTRRNPGARRFPCLEDARTCTRHQDRLLATAVRACSKRFSRYEA